MILLACSSIVAFILFLRMYKLQVADKLNGSIADLQHSSSSAKDYFSTREIVLYNFVKKFKLKALSSFLFIGLFLLFNISANISIWPNVKGLTLNDKENSVAFRSLRGGNCINEFTALKPVLDAASTNNYDKEDIKGILGRPDKISTDGKVFYYNLHPSVAGCTGVVEFTAAGIAVKCNVQNCN